jgi:hypothetical protein
MSKSNTKEVRFAVPPEPSCPYAPKPVLHTVPVNSVVVVVLVVGTAVVLVLDAAVVLGEIPVVVVGRIVVVVVVGIVGARARASECPPPAATATTSANADT